MSYQEEKNYEFTENGTSVDFPWLTMSTMEYTFERGYQFIEHQNFLNSKVNDKVSEADYRDNIRYLKIKLLGEMTAERYLKLEDIDEDSNVQRKFCRILDQDLLELDLSQKELEDGFRYLKIYLPFDTFERGWLTTSEIEEGWSVSGKRNVVKSTSSKRRRKFRKRQKESKMMDEVKKYISIKD